MIIHIWPYPLPLLIKATQDKQFLRWFQGLVTNVQHHELRFISISSWPLFFIKRWWEPYAFLWWWGKKALLINGRMSLRSLCVSSLPSSLPSARIFINLQSTKHKPGNKASWFLKENCTLRQCVVSHMAVAVKTSLTFKQPSLKGN